jgi:L-histidine Nalpha-methyltransferase
MPPYHPPPHEPRFLQLHHSDAQVVKRELLEGLLAPRARIAPKFLYDALGSRLFEAITELDEYYPTRTEAAIFEQHAVAMAACIGPVGSLVDLGAGNCTKAMRLLPVLQPQAYVAVDISVDFLQEALRTVQRRHPGLDVAGVGIDFAQGLALPEGVVQGRPLYFYPGSSIGNFTPDEALRFLRQLQRSTADGGLLIGVDLVKAASTLEAAYDDAIGVTAAFNLNLLLHANRLIGSDFSPRAWRHHACWCAEDSRIEMHLQARHALTLRWPGGERLFAAGESIHTENSTKYTVPGFTALLHDAGYAVTRSWTDAENRFAVFWAHT